MAELYFNTFNTLDENNNDTSTMPQPEFHVKTPETTTPISGFEGCEKRLVVTFAPTADLRAISRQTIDAMLTEAKCTIISQKKNSSYDSYVLSESSLFIFPHKLLLKTCGTTTLLAAIPIMLQAAKEIGTEPTQVQFSRYDFLFPDKQPYPHHGFAAEVEYLNSFFGNGRAYILGPTAPAPAASASPADDDDAAHGFVSIPNKLHLFAPTITGHTPRWHLYLADCTADSSAVWDSESVSSSSSLEESCELNKPASGAGAGAASTEHTFEMVMFDLDRDVMHKFYNSANANGDSKISADFSSSAKEATVRGGIDQIIPGSDIDDFLFNPCGYSCNGLKDDVYFTIHITPEPQCSFVSFESNIRLDSYTPLVQKLVDTFKPGSFCVAHLSNAIAGVDLHHGYDGFHTQSAVNSALHDSFVVNCGRFAGIRPPTCHHHPARSALLASAAAGSAACPASSSSALATALASALASASASASAVRPDDGVALELKLPATMSLNPKKALDEEYAVVPLPTTPTLENVDVLAQAAPLTFYVREEDDPNQLQFENDYGMIEADDLNYDDMAR